MRPWYRNLDWTIILLWAALVAVGLTAIFSASPSSQNARPMSQPKMLNMKLSATMPSIATSPMVKIVRSIRGFSRARTECHTAVYRAQFHAACRGASGAG